VIAALFFLSFGGFLSWIAILNWRHRHGEKISLLQAAILKTTGEEPLPLTRFGKVLQWFQVIMASILGPILLIVGIAMLIDELGS
jgi:hypothetical protein